MTLKPMIPLTGVKEYAGTQRLTRKDIEMADEEVEINVDGVNYLLIPSPKVVAHSTGPLIAVFPYLHFTLATDNNILSQGSGIEAITTDDGGSVLILLYRTLPGQTISKSALQEFQSNVLAADDVFQPGFYRNMVFYGSKKEDLNIEPDVYDYLSDCKTENTYFVVSEADTPPGPYVIRSGQCWQPWRIYHDFNSIFMTTFKPAGDRSGRLVTLDTPYAGTSGRVIVPSRCYYRPSKDRPLDGARITVKDNIDIAGHKTSLCNRAWLELYPEKSKTAACVQALIDAGAIILGKVKLQAMIMREEPLECVEFTAPFNPRADGYQVPSGSSHASAAGVASYQWLDFSIGSDTNGSGRKPASYNGCYSIRPSTGIMNTEGVIGQFPLFDMPVFFGRDLSRFSEFISVWYGDSPMLRTPSESSFKILYPLDYLPTPNEAQTNLIERFVKGLEASLGISRTNISLSELWKQDLPDGPEHEDISKYLYLAGAYPYYHDSYHDLASFRHDYREKFGKPPFIHHAMRWQWDVSKTISLEERDKYWRRSEKYRKWLLDRVFDSDSSGVITVMVFPIEVGEPNYRESEIPPMSILPGFASLNMSPMARAPELTAPVGDIPYDSWVTQRQEPLPVAVSVIGAPGTDLILADLVAKGLKGAGLPTQVKTGRSVFGPH